jgi:S1-C subfamily serine protease
MHLTIARLTVLSGLIIVATGLESAAQEPESHRNVVERYGLQGFIQPIGLHHGFHIEKITAGSPASRDRLEPHDTIIQVNGESIRSLEHLRTILTDAYEDDGEVEVTIMKGLSLEHHVVKCHVKGRAGEQPVRKSRTADPESKN